MTGKLCLALREVLLPGLLYYIKCVYLPWSVTLQQDYNMKLLVWKCHNFMLHSNGNKPRLQTFKLYVS